MAGCAWRCATKQWPRSSIQAAEARVLRFEGRQGRKRVGDAAEEALGDGRAQQRVAFSGRLREQRLRGRQRLGEAALPEQLRAAGLTSAGIVR